MAMTRGSGTRENRLSESGKGLEKSTTTEVECIPVCEEKNKSPTRGVRRGSTEQIGKKCQGEKGRVKNC